MTDLNTVNHVCSRCGVLCRTLADVRYHDCVPQELEDRPVFVDDDNVRHPIINPVVSDPSDTLDQLVQKASTPNLASLFKQGQAAGLIKPTEGYV